MTRTASVALAALLATSCGDGGPGSIEDGPVLLDESVRPPESLAAIRALEWRPEAGAIAYNDRVVPYDLNSALFSDYALKARAIYVPEGQTIAYDAEGVLQMPVGTAIFKTFYFPADFREPEQDITLIETRVLIHTADGWEAWPYIWNEEQTDAILTLGGETRTLSFVDDEGTSQTANYLIPQRNQCVACHERNEDGETRMVPLGPAARHLNRDVRLRQRPGQSAHAHGRYGHAQRPARAQHGPGRLRLPAGRGDGRGRD